MAEPLKIIQNKLCGINYYHYLSCIIKNNLATYMIWTYIKATNFFPKYCPKIKDWKKKLLGEQSIM